MGRLQDKVAVVMGATRQGNMGQAITRRFLAEGAQLVAAGRTATGLENIARETGCRWQACDIRRKADIERLARFTLDTSGAIDVAVNCAATGQYSQFEQTTEAELDEMLAIIFKGSF